MTLVPPDLRYEVRDGLAILTFDRPDSSVNLLTSAVMLGLDDLLDSIEEAARSGEVRALLIRSGKRRDFFAGVDLEELAAIDSAAVGAEMSRRGQSILLRLERLAIPTLAAIDGTCVGGGLELALACDFRTASDHPSTRLGLPETRIGILPGLGGTVRTPRLVGLRAALELILSGKQISAGHALSIGLIDKVISAEHFGEESEAQAEALARIGKKPLQRGRTRLKRWIQDGPAARWLTLHLTRKSLHARTGGHYPALPAALEVALKGLGMPAAAAYDREAEAFGRLAVTPECKNLIAVFQMTEGARKQAPKGRPASVKRAAVVGAGIMGAGIAELFAYQAIPVYVADIDKERVESGIRRARDLLDKAAERTGWSKQDLKTRAGCLRGTTVYGDFKHADIVVEAVTERLEVKQDVLARIESSVRSDTAIATNTSTIPVSKLQQSLLHPERVCGLHFFNPPHRMPLVEVVRGADTSDDTLATALEVAVRLGKTPIAVNDSPGFVVNRILAAYLTEAGHLLQSGLDIERLDGIMARFGMPVGPLRLLDEIGLDVAAEVSQTMLAGFGDRFTPAPIMEAVLGSGVTGRKSGRGFYRYDGSEPRGVDGAVESLLSERVQDRTPSDAEAEERMILSMINEAARVLDDGVIDTPASLDVATVMGTGFPPFRGGLLRYADSLGLDWISDRLRDYSQQAGSRFDPADGMLGRKRFHG